MTYELLHGDCLEAMAAMDAGSVDAVCCDPPYGLEFMGKEWDRFAPQTSTSAMQRSRAGNTDRDPSNPHGRHGKSGTSGARSTFRCRNCGGWSGSFSEARKKRQKQCECEVPDLAYAGAAPAMVAFDDFSYVWATEALRVLKPSHYLLAFGGTRTWHRLACAIEDAGFEIRDTLMWLYGSGFPKGKSCLKPAWEPIILARKPGPMRELGIEECRIGTDTSRADRYNGKAAHGKSDIMPRLQNRERPFDAVPGRWPANLILECTCDETREGTAKTPTTYVRHSDSGNRNAYAPGIGEPAGAASKNYGGADGKEPVRIHTDPNCPCAMLDGQTGNRSGSHHQTPTESGNAAFGGGVYDNSSCYGDSGGASRFFYCAKSSRRERNAGCEGMEAAPAGVGFRAVDSGEYLDFVHESPSGVGEWLREQRKAAGLTDKDVALHFPSATGGITGCLRNWEHEASRPTPQQWMKLREIIGFDNRYDSVMTETRPMERQTFDDRDRPRAANHHPTVKPLALMRWLVKLVAQPGDVVLDPFAGSGTTGVACAMEGREFIGIEREAEYVEIARRRIEAASAQGRLPLDESPPLPPVAGRPT